MYLMNFLTVIFALVSGLLAYLILIVPHPSGGHNDEDHHQYTDPRTTIFIATVARLRRVLLDAY